MVCIEDPLLGSSLMIIELLSSHQLWNPSFPACLAAQPYQLAPQSHHAHHHYQPPLLPMQQQIQVVHWQYNNPKLFVHPVVTPFLLLVLMKLAATGSSISLQLRGDRKPKKLECIRNLEMSKILIFCNFSFWLIFFSKFYLNKILLPYR